MKKLALAAALSASASLAFAGSMGEPVMEEVVEPVMEDTAMVEEASSASGSGILVPLLFLVLVAAAVAD